MASVSTLQKSATVNDDHFTNEKNCQLILRSKQESSKIISRNHQVTEDTVKKYIINDYFNESLPRNDPWFLKPVRRIEKSLGFVTPIKWINLISITLFHILCVVATFYMYFWLNARPKWQTVLFGFFMGGTAGFGVTGGAHRYWCHRSYKAKMPLQILLMLCYSAAGQNNIYDWVRDHRIHHKFSETSADPHDVTRGFFFSHVGWLMMRKHPAVLKEGSKIDMTDISNDPLIRFHTSTTFLSLLFGGMAKLIGRKVCAMSILLHRLTIARSVGGLILGVLLANPPLILPEKRAQRKQIVPRYFIVFKLLLCFLLPTLVPRLWGEEWTIAFLSQSLLRYMFTLNFTWSVNSFAHIWGNKPYDRFIMPVENWGVSIVALGEGWHNYHHTFPWDYKAAELAYMLNFTTFILDQFARIGWAYDMKKASPQLIKRVIMNRGEKQH